MAQTITSSRIDPTLPLVAIEATSGPQAAACNDSLTVGRFHVGTGHIELTQNAGYTTARNSEQPQLSIRLLAFGGSPHTPHVRSIAKSPAPEPQDVF